MTDYRIELLEKIKERRARPAVIGLGYVGLPLAVELARAGFQTVGIDVMARKVEMINAGQSYVGDVPDSEVAAHVAAGRLRATQDYSALRDCDTVSICVPTPLSKMRDPDLAYIIAAADAIARYVHAGMLIVLESTTYPGTTEEIIAPRLLTNGLTVGRDVFLAFSPERIDPGRRDYMLKNTPKVVGGVTPACREVVLALYQYVTDYVVPVSSAAAAEMAKLLENTFRAVNIALVNEVLLMCDRLGLDAWEVIEAAATKPYGFMKFTPGPGVGGHCLEGQEMVRYRWGGENGVITLAELYQRAAARCPRALWHFGGSFVAPEGLEVLSIHPDTGVQSWKPVSYLFEREYVGPVVDLQTTDNRRLTVTDRHPMLVHAEGALHTREALALQPGDLLPLVHRPEIVGADRPALRIIDLVPPDLSARVRVRHPQGWEHARTALRPLLGEAARDALRDNSLPLDAWRALAPELQGKPEQLRLVTGRGPSHSSFPATLAVDGELARLLGYYLSEGCISELAGQCPRMRFSFNRDEVEYLADVRALLQRLGLRVSEFNDPQWHTTTLKVGGWLLPWLFRDVLHTGVDAYSMRIPDDLMAAPAPMQLELLKGLFRGDGDVHVRGGTRAYRKQGRDYIHQDNAGQVGYFTSSPQLLEQVTLLLEELGFTPWRKADKPQLRFYATADLERLERWFLGAKAGRLASLRANKRRRAASRRPQVHERYTVTRVKQVQTRQTATRVYSVEVHGTHTFAASSGLYVHNCIPLDPQYLAWKLRTLNYTARFIQLAEEINRSMPEHWVDKVAQALNATGRAVNGSRVLVLGVTYKPDVDDVRESPALDIIKLLEDRGANVHFHDPYVPSLEPEGLATPFSELTEAALAGSDCVMVVTNHSVYDWEWIKRHARRCVDTRHVLAHLPD